jgi:hypothetical protein
MPFPQPAHGNHLSLHYLWAFFCPWERMSITNINICSL